MHDIRAHLQQERINRIDIGALARTETDVMQTNALLDEFFTPVLLGRSRDGYSSASAHAVEEAVAAHHWREPQANKQPLIERQRALEIAHRELYVGDAIDLHGLLYLVVTSPQNYWAVLAKTPTAGRACCWARPSKGQREVNPQAMLIVKKCQNPGLKKSICRQ